MKASWASERGSHASCHRETAEGRVLTAAIAPYTEKGADAVIASDMTHGAVINEYDVAILVSSNGDFAPAVERVVSEYDKAVEVVYF